MTNGIARSRVSAGVAAYERNGVASANQVHLEGMMAEERRAQIVQNLRKAGRVRVNEPASLFNTSAVTIRNDLNDLVQRSHGGAMLPGAILREPPLRQQILPAQHVAHLSLFGDRYSHNRQKPK